MEPAAPDFEVAFSDLKRPCYSPHNIAEHLIFEERKIPGVLSVPEALREAERAASIQDAHWRVYGEAARLPFPLLVACHGSEAVERVTGTLRRELSDAAFEIAQTSLSAGLGVYVYYYPSHPVRARDLEILLEGLAFRRRMLVVMASCDPEEVVRRWISGLVRLLYLGVLPGTLASLRTGICCQSQNACMDGGFVDVEALTSFGALRDDTAVFAALQFSTDAMVETVRALLTGTTDPTRSEGSAGRFDGHLVRQHVLSLIGDALEAEARPGLELDERVRIYFAKRSSLSQLVERLGAYYPGDNWEFVEAARRFRDFGFALLRELRGF